MTWTVDAVRELARTIAQTLDDQSASGRRTAMSARIGCYITSDDCWVYRDDSVEIVCSKLDQSGVIWKVANGNPVASWSRLGDAVRWHGEIHHVMAHLEQLSSPLTLIARKATRDPVQAPDDPEL